MYLIIFFVILWFTFVFASGIQKAERLLQEIKKARSQYRGIARARVCEVERRRVMRGMEYFYPTFTYEVDGISYLGGGSIYSTLKKDYETGKTFEIRYDEHDPQCFMLADDEKLYRTAGSEKQTNCNFIIGIWVVYFLLVLAAGLGFPLL